MTTLNTKSPPRPADSFSAFVDAPNRFLFFTGKGGVGKTSLACASAIAPADQGRRVLLVSTDPASNLDEVLGQKLNGAPMQIPGVPNLLALNIDPEAAALQDDLRRAQIEPFAWVINQSFAESGSRDPLLVARGADELPYIREVSGKYSKRSVIVRWVAEEPVGPEKLRQLFADQKLN